MQRLGFRFIEPSASRGRSSSVDCLRVPTRSKRDTTSGSVFQFRNRNRRGPFRIATKPNGTSCGTTSPSFISTNSTRCGPHRRRAVPLNRTPRAHSLTKESTATTPDSPSNSSPDPAPVSTSSTLKCLLPFVPWGKVVAAWICTVVALLSLLAFLPKFGRMAALVGGGDLPGVLRLGSLVLGLLGLRVAAQYGQDVLLADVSQTVVRRRPFF